MLNMPGQKEKETVVTGITDHIPQTDVNVKAV